MSSQPPAPPPPPIPPALPSIGGFEIVRELGRGAMGIVYLARDERIGRQVAIKTIDIAAMGGGEELSAAQSSHERALIEEARTAGNLTHPNIVTIHQVGIAGRLLYVVMEYVAGGSLAARLSPGVPAQLDWSMRILREVAEALDEAHKSEIVHRDIKPSNILLTPSNDAAKIADFGLARAFAAQRSQTMVAGTPYFMSPEQVEGKPLDGRSDQFSLGVLAYQLLTGHMPFDADNMVSLAFQISTVEPVAANLRNQALPAPVAAVIARAMTKDRERRFPTCVGFVAELAKAFQAPAPPPPRIPTATRSKASIFFALAGLSVVFVALVTAAIWLFSRKDATPPVQPAKVETARVDTEKVETAKPVPVASTPPTSPAPTPASSAASSPTSPNEPLFFPASPPSASAAAPVVPPATLPATLPTTRPTTPPATASLPKATTPTPPVLAASSKAVSPPKAGAPPKPIVPTKSFDGEATSALLAAVRDGGSPGQLEALLDRNANPDGNDNGNPLYNALLSCREDAAQVLLARKADPNLIGLFELPPLVAAIQSQRYGKPCAQRESMIKSLLDKGAKPDGVRGFDSPIERAAQQGPEAASLVRLLLDRGANPQPALERSIGPNGRRPDSQPCDTTVFDMLISRGAKPGAVSPSSDRLPLHTASEVGCEDIVRVLLSNGAAVDQLDSDGRSALYFTADRGRNRWAAQIAKTLVAAGANPNLAARPRESSSASRGVTPLMLSVKKDIDFLTALLDKGGDPNIADAQGRTTLHHAIDWGRDKAVNLLISRGAKLGVRDKLGRTPLGLARSKGLRDSDPCVKLLLAANAPE